MSYTSRSDRLPWASGQRGIGGHHFLHDPAGLVQCHAPNHYCNQQLHSSIMCDQTALLTLARGDIPVRAIRSRSPRIWEIKSRLPPERNDNETRPITYLQSVSRFGGRGRLISEKGTQYFRAQARENLGSIPPVRSEWTAAWDPVITPELIT